MLWSGFILGLLGSLHCVGMCGPIAFLLPLDRQNKSKRLFQVFLYHGGRLFAYGLMGVLFGALGKGLYVFGLQQKLSILTGVLMIAAVIVTAKSIKLFKLNHYIFRWISKIKQHLGNGLRKKTADTFLTIGFLNGLLPCGLVYMALFGAIASGELLQGSVYMILFGAGTIPLMTTAVYFGNFLNGKLRSKIRRAIPVMVTIVGILFILRGLGLGIPYVSPKLNNEQVSSSLECHNLSPSEENKMTLNK